jgi:hypothetical protein
MARPDETDLDRMILSALKPHYMKVVRIIWDVCKECEAGGLDVADEDIAARIVALSEAGMINAMGNLENWRFSEVCLKPEEGA